MSIRTMYEKWYDSDEYYWGFEPAELCYELMKIIPPSKDIKVLDIGCGEGKDAVFLAKQGYSVSAFDITENGIRKTKALAEKEGVEINAFIADINDLNLTEKYDIIYSTGTVQYLFDDKKDIFFKKIKEATNVNGIHWFNVFVDKPFIPLAPDWDIEEKMWQTGELFAYYPDWKLLKVDETIFECHSSGVPHNHCMDVVIAQKVVE